MAREIGISKVRLTPLKIDTDIAGNNVTQVEFDNAKAINVKYAVSLETQNEFATGEYYGDNIAENSINQLSKMSVTLEVSSQISPEDDAKITGRDFENTKSATGTKTTTPYYAVSYEILMDDGTVRKRTIYKVQFTRNSQTNATKEDSLEGQTYTYEGIAVPMNYLPVMDMIMDQTEVDNYVQDIPNGDTLTEDIVKDHFNNFFKKVILPDETRETAAIN